MLLHWVDDKKFCDKKTKNIKIDLWAWWLDSMARLEDKEDK